MDKLWNWQQTEWPKFTYNDALVADIESKFRFESGHFLGAYSHVSNSDRDNLMIALISDESLKTSEIEGISLNRDSLQSSIRREFGLAYDHRSIPPAEQGIATMMRSLYLTYNHPLTHALLFKWHAMLTNGRTDLQNIGEYRTHSDPMQIVSGPIHTPKIHFEAPPSDQVTSEMDQFLTWFSDSHPNGPNPIPPLTRASIAHLYFVSIHPFEDGNGRIARAISEKCLAESLGHPTLIALSHTIHRHRKAYYDRLEFSNKSCEITGWIQYFSQTILEAQQYSTKQIQFLIQKTKLYDRIRGSLNPRQDKVVTRLFREGVDGFQGGLSAENYLAITRTSRATATRDLADLVEKGILTVTGNLKGTRYFLTLD